MFYSKSTIIKFLCHLYLRLDFSSGYCIYRKKLILKSLDNILITTTWYLDDISKFFIELLTSWCFDITVVAKTIFASPRLRIEIHLYQEAQKYIMNNIKISLYFPPNQATLTNIVYQKCSYGYCPHFVLFRFYSLDIMLQYRVLSS